MQINLSTLFLIALLNFTAFASNKKPAFRLPFKLINNLIIIEVRINHSEPLNFILDTGIKNTLLTNLNNNQSIIVEDINPVKVLGYGSGDPVEGFLSVDNELKIGDLTLQKCSLILIDAINFSGKFGLTVNGMMGHEIFNRFIVEIDYVQAQISFFHPSDFSLLFKRSWAKYSLHLIHYKPFVQLEAEFTKHKENLCLMLDLGASDAIWLIENEELRLNLKDEPIFYLGSGINGKITGRRARIQKLNWGNFCFGGVVVSIPDTFSLNPKLLKDKRNGSIGSEILKRFHTIISFQDSCIYLKKNHWYKNPFTYNQSCIEVETPVPGLPLYIIADIGEYSPAKSLNLQLGDEIISINGQSTVNLSLDQINLILSGQRNKRIRMKVMSNGVMNKVKFTLADRIKNL